ncbi:putative carboxylesterase [Triangularia verruculosa]|uniref:Carboxylesterase n=1 Tax=Triangularia verruculosa TaxID=2587418 RepID=A0AAN6XEB0_9PEZI|nr:putative carboxylesterase [Triangularia verruculosa]
MLQQSAILQHPTVGPIRGVKKVDGVTQFLGVQYATLKDRFSRAELLKSYPSDHPRLRYGVFDATTIAAIPLSPADGCAWEHKLIQQSLESPSFEQSDTECLTLNIAVPDLQADGPEWPVLALVHGGAFATGSSSYPQYDLARIVKMSVKIGKPIIAVGINYRLGVPGFLHSSAMKAAGYKPNNGLDDQRQGLLWIKHHIAGFGGDPHRVTYIGESSGAASGTFHLHSKEPLFSQLISMSGSSLVKAKQPELAERSFKTALQLLNVSETEETAQIQCLLEVPMEDIREKVGRKVPMAPIVDGDLVPRTTSYALMADTAQTTELFPGMKWCKRIMFGDCQMDGNAYGPRVGARQDILPRTLATFLATTLDPVDPALAPTIVSGYGLDTAATVNSQESLKACLDLATGICFGLGARTFVRSWSQAGLEAFLYHFNVPNPWDGPWKGYAAHILDIAFVLQNYQEKLPAGQQKAAKKQTEDAISFIYGEVPWPAYKIGAQEGAMVYFAREQSSEDESRYVPGEITEETGRRDILQKIMTQEVFDKVMDAWDLFMKGPK